MNGGFSWLFYYGSAFPFTFCKDKKIFPIIFFRMLPLFSFVLQTWTNWRFLRCVLYFNGVFSVWRQADTPIGYGRCRMIGEKE